MSKLPPKHLKAFASGKGKKGKRPDEDEEREDEEDRDELDVEDENEEEDGEEDEEDESEDDDEDEDGDSGEDDADEDVKIARLVVEEGKRVNDGKEDGQLKRLMADFDPEENPPAWVRDEEKWDRARDAVDPDGEGGEKYDEPWAVVAHVYKRMGGKIKGGSKRRED